ncbi:MAG: hypothetical protein R3D58_02015 [Saprospiraceae bacterium]
MVLCSKNIFFNPSPANLNIECISNLVVTDDPAVGTYEAREQVATMGTVTVPAFAMTEFLAGVEVLLNPGFSALLNCDFLARIQPCQACVRSRPVALTLEETAFDQPRIHVHYLDKQSPELRGSHDGGIALSIFPNPFDQHFTIQFELPEAGNVYLDVVDFTGRSVNIIYPNEYLDAGVYQMLIPAAQLAVGMYECRIVTDFYQEQFNLIKIR